MTFALLDDDRVVTAVDAKPKTTQHLQRLANVEAEPRVGLLVDRYNEAWEQLWWVRLDGTARVVHEEPERIEMIEPLLMEYGQYAEAPPTGPVVVVEVSDVRYWSAKEDAVKALVHTRYGGPEGLRIKDVPVPTAGCGEVR